MTAATPAALAPFPGPGDFYGDCTRAPIPVVNGLQSTYSGSVVVTMVDRDIVEKVLPQGTLLAERIDKSNGHPVVHLIGRQDDASMVVWGIPRPLGGGYQEMILLVPFVQHGSGTTWHNYAVRMYLDHEIPVDWGNGLYGYAKEMARFHVQSCGNQTVYDVIDDAGPTVFFRNELRVTSGWSGADDLATVPTRWLDLRDILAMPILGMIGSVFVCSYWEWGLAEAQIAAAESVHRVITRFRPGMEDWETMGPLRNVLDGAVSLRRVRWRLANPWRCVF